MPRPEAISITPRGLKTCDVAAYLGLSQTDFFRKRAAMEAAGFPRPDPITRRYDRRAIDAWLDRRSGLDPYSADEDAWMRRLDDGRSAA